MTRQRHEANPQRPYTTPATPLIISPKAQARTPEHRDRWSSVPWGAAKCDNLFHPPEQNFSSAMGMPVSPRVVKSSRCLSKEDRPELPGELDDVCLVISAWCPPIQCDGEQFGALSCPG